jgi:GNAT superfamily N-acetyltransferase
MELTDFGPEQAYATRLLAPPDLRALQALFERGHDYFELVTGAPPAADEAPRAFVAGPPQKSVNDKRVIGIFTADETLVGVLDALTDWPESGEWTMGMLLLDPAHRRRGLGRATLAAYEHWAAAEGAQRVRTAVVAQHAEGIAFLEDAGYERVSTLENYDAGGARPTVFFFAKDLPRGEKGLS